MANVLPQPRSIVAGVVAGIVGAILIAICVTVAQSVVFHPGAPLNPVGVFQFDASVLVGKIAYSDPVYAALGGVLHLLTSIGWGVGYAYMAERQPQLVTLPVRSGAAFGLVVYFAMQLVLVAGSLFQQPTPAEFGVELVAHIVFFGIPVALVVSRMLRTP
jgi:hypothetical protein